MENKEVQVIKKSTVKRIYKSKYKQTCNIQIKNENFYLSLMQPPGIQRWGINKKMNYRIHQLSLPLYISLWFLIQITLKL